MKSKKKTKVIKRKTEGKSNMYFNENTTKAIIEYQASSDNVEKEKIYMAEIYPAFDKLVENLIFIHGFKGLHDTYDDLKSDCITFLYEAINKFDVTKGFKPFSYFNVIAKNWLIIRSNNRANKAKKSLSIDDVDSMSRADKETIDAHYMIPSQDEQLEIFEFINNVHNLLSDIRDNVLRENELRCIDAIIQIFKIVNDSDDKPGEDLLLNKRAVFMYIREISGLNPKQLTTAISSIKRIYTRLKNVD